MPQTDLNKLLTKWEKYSKPEFKERDIGIHAQLPEIYIDDLDFRQYDVDEQFPDKILNRCYQQQRKCFVCLLEHKNISGEINDSATISLQNGYPYNTRLCAEKHLPVTLGGTNKTNTNEYIENLILNYKRIWIQQYLKRKTILENRNQMIKRVHKSYKTGVKDHDKRIKIVQKQIDKEENRIRTAEKNLEKKLRKHDKDINQLNYQIQDKPIVQSMLNEINQKNRFGVGFGANKLGADKCFQFAASYLKQWVGYVDHEKNLSKGDTELDQDMFDRIKDSVPGLLYRRARGNCSSQLKQNMSLDQETKNMLDAIDTVIASSKSVSNVADVNNVRKEMKRLIPILKKLKAKQINQRASNQVVPYMGNQGRVTGDKPVQFTGPQHMRKHRPGARGNELVPFTTENRADLRVDGDVQYTGGAGVTAIKPYTNATGENQLALRPKPQLPRRPSRLNPKPRPIFERENATEFNVVSADQTLLNTLEGYYSNIQYTTLFKKLRKEIKKQQANKEKISFKQLKKILKAALKPDYDALLAKVFQQRKQDEINTESEIEAIHNNIQQFVERKQIREHEKTMYIEEASNDVDEKKKEIHREINHQLKSIEPYLYCLQYLTGEKDLPLILWSFLKNRYYKVKKTKKAVGAIRGLMKFIAFRKFHYRAGFLKAALILGEIEHMNEKSEKQQQETEDRINHTFNEMKLYQEEQDLANCEIGTNQGDKICLPGSLYREYNGCNTVGGIDSGEYYSIKKPGFDLNATIYKVLDDENNVYIVFDKKFDDKGSFQSCLKDIQSQHRAEKWLVTPKIVYCATFPNTFKVIWIVESPENNYYKNMAIEMPEIFEYQYNIVGHTIFRFNKGLQSLITDCGHLLKFDANNALSVQRHSYQLMYCFMEVWFMNPANEDIVYFFRELFRSLYVLKQDAKLNIHKLTRDKIWWKYDDITGYSFKFIDVEEDDNFVNEPPPTTSKDRFRMFRPKKKKSSKYHLSEFLYEFLFGPDVQLNNKQKIELYRFILVKYSEANAIYNNDIIERLKGFPPKVFDDDFFFSVLQQRGGITAL
jgi:hypothetical protein